MRYCSQLIGKDPDAGKDWGQEEKGVTEDEMVRCYHWLNGYEFEQTPGNSEGQGSLACCSSWGCKVSEMAYWLNNNKILWRKQIRSSSILPRAVEAYKFWTELVTSTLPVHLGFGGTWKTSKSISIDVISAGQKARISGLEEDKCAS